MIITISNPTIRIDDWLIFRKVARPNRHGDGHSPMTLSVNRAIDQHISLIGVVSNKKNHKTTHHPILITIAFYWQLTRD